MGEVGVDASGPLDRLAPGAAVLTIWIGAFSVGRRG